MLSVGRLSTLVAMCCDASPDPSQDQIELAKTRVAYLTTVNLIPVQQIGHGLRRHRRYGEDGCCMASLFCLLISCGVRTERFAAVRRQLEVHPLWPAAKAGKATWLTIDLDPASEAVTLTARPDPQPGQLILLLETSQLFGTVKRVLEVEAQRGRRRK